MAVLVRLLLLVMMWDGLIQGCTALQHNVQPTNDTRVATTIGGRRSKRFSIDEIPLVGKTLATVKDYIKNPKAAFKANPGFASSIVLAFIPSPYLDVVDLDGYGGCSTGEKGYSLVTYFFDDEIDKSKIYTDPCVYRLVGKTVGQTLGTTAGAALGTAIAGPLGGFVGGVIVGFIGGIIGEFIGSIVCAIFCIYKPDPPPDFTVPVVTCPPSQSIDAEPLEVTAFISFYKASAKDDKDGDVSDSVMLWIVHSYYLPNETSSGWYEGNVYQGEAFFRFYAVDEGNNIGFCDFHIKVSVLRCSLPVPFDYGTCNTYQGSTALGFPRECACILGYITSDVTKSECVRLDPGHAQWDKEPPTCSAVTCPMLPPILHSASVVCENDYFDAGVDACTGSVCLWNSRCHVVCEDGFAVPVGMSPLLICQKDGRWDGPAPHCIDAVPPVLIQCPQMSLVVAAPRSREERVTWEVPSYEDNGGLPVTVKQRPGRSSGDSFPGGEHLVEYIATDTAGNQNLDCRFKVVVKVLRCRGFVVPRFMAEPGCDEGTLLGSRCTFACKYGAKLLGASSATCVSDNNQVGWKYDGNQPVCEVATCPSLTTSSVAQLSCHEWSLGDMCQVGCPAGMDQTDQAPISYHCALQESTWTPDTAIADCTSVQPATGFQRRISVTLSALYNINNLQSRLVTVRDQVGSDVEASILSQDISEATVLLKLFTQSQSHAQTLADKVRNILLDNDTGRKKREAVPVSIKLLKMQLLCPEGLVASQLSKGCVGCPRGQYAAGDVCLPCPVGSYQNTTAAVSCKPCPAGTSTADHSSISQQQCKELCAAGSYSANKIVPCVECESGWYQDEVGTSSCKSCPPGTGTLTDGATKEDQCTGFDIYNAKSADLEFSANASTVHFWVRPSPAHSVCPLLKVGGLPVLIINTTNHSLQFDAKSVSIKKKTWLSVALTIRGNKMALYLNGDFVGESISRSPPIISLLGQELCPGLYTAIGMFSSVLDAEEVAALSNKCSAHKFGDVLSWHDVISNIPLQLAPHLKESICDDTDECLSTPCQHAATCEDMLHAFRCHCSLGYEGQVCDVKTTFCSTHNCRNQAVCVEGETNYTCACTEGFTGAYCEKPIVDGKWSSWSEWQECTVTCGSGSQKRFRFCSDPAPSNGGKTCRGDNIQAQPCNVLPCPRCVELQPPKNGNLSCSEEGEEVTCSPYCLFGMSFNSDVRANYSCGPSTNYLWTDQYSVLQDVMTLPGCTADELPEDLRASVVINYVSMDCVNMDKAETQAQAELSTLPCAQLKNCTVKASPSVSCSNRMKRNGEGAGVRVEMSVQRPVTYAPPIVNFIDNETAVNITLADVFEFAEASGRLFVETYKALEQDAEHVVKDIRAGRYDVPLEDGQVHAAEAGTVSLTVHCPPGLTNHHDMTCTACPAGRYEDKGYCRKCPIGSYQLIEGSTSCVPCGKGNSTAAPGSMSPLDCKVLCQPGTYFTNKTCVACPEATYQPYLMQDTCLPCPENTTSPVHSAHVTSCVGDSNTGDSNIAFIVAPVVSVVIVVVATIIVCVAVRGRKKMDKHGEGDAHDVEPDRQKTTAADSTLGSCKSSLGSNYDSYDRRSEAFAQLPLVSEIEMPRMGPH